MKKIAPTAIPASLRMEYSTALERIDPEKKESLKKLLERNDYVVVGDASRMRRKRYGGAAVIVISMKDGELFAKLETYKCNESMDVTIQDAEVLPLADQLDQMPRSKRVLVATDQKHFITFSQEGAKSRKKPQESWELTCSVCAQFEYCHLVHVKSHSKEGGVLNDLHELTDRIAKEIMRREEDLGRIEEIVIKINLEELFY